MWIKKNQDGSSSSFNFIPPTGANEQTNEVLFPIAEKQTPDYEAVLEVEINQMETFLQPEELTGNVTINLAIAEQVTPGAKLYVKLSADATNRTATIGAGFDADAPEVAVAAGTVVFKTYVYDGVAFVPAA